MFKNCTSWQMYPTVCKHSRCHHLNLSPLPSSAYAKQLAQCLSQSRYPADTPAPTYFRLQRRPTPRPHHAHLTAGHALWDAIHESPEGQRVHLQVPETRYLLNESSARWCQQENTIKSVSRLWTQPWFAFMKTPGYPHLLLRWEGVVVFLSLGVSDMKTANKSRSESWEVMNVEAYVLELVINPNKRQDSLRVFEIPQGNPHLFG